MRRFVTMSILTLAAGLILLDAAPAQETLTYPDLVRRLTGLEHLAVLPAKGETCKQWSSWDRASKYDAAAGKYVAWDANGDGGHFIRREGDRVVMAEMEGPGCIFRTWSALAKSGRVKIYVDGQETPAVDMPFEHYFDGKHAPFDYPMLSYNLSDQGCKGFDLYYPIPYQKSCKIVAEPDWGQYYQFTYATFPKGTNVPTFSAAVAKENAAALAAVNDFLRDRQGTDPAAPREGQDTFRDTVRVASGDTASVLELTGARAITAIRVSSARGTQEEEMEAARKLVLRITWDDQKEPAVWCPLGDFFGTAPGINYYKSLATGITEGRGGYAYWYMPFAKNAKVELVNEDGRDHEIDYEIVHAPLGRPFEGLGHFHAKWHRDVFELPKDRWPDWVMLRTQGRGRFCGVMLHVWNPLGGWWGEGDEKFFVDGEKFPSTFGTGSEDYFGYAWCDPNLFQRPFHCQTHDERNAGHQSVLRWQVADNVPFQESFEGCIEKYYTNQERGTLYALVACWYLSPDGVDPFGPVPVEERDGYYVSPPRTAAGFKILGRPRGAVDTQGMAGFGEGKWQRDDQLWWTGAQPGDKLDLVVPVKSTGPCDLSVVLTKAQDYGIVQLYLDGKKVGDPIDLYNPDVVPTEPIPLGRHDLTEGEHKLTVEIVGANDKAIKSYMFGLDYVIFKPAR
ncbi:MAG: DUF2961 domain-containing protein [Planctomycetia bacterium]|nr:DUF2961 domain-containing protein [Planctomycetia bacterium]